MEGVSVTDQERIKRLEEMAQMTLAAVVQLTDALNSFVNVVVQSWPDNETHGDVETAAQGIWDIMNELNAARPSSAQR